MEQIYRIKLVDHVEWKTYDKNRYCIQKLRHFIFKWLPYWSTLNGCNDLSKEDAESYMKQILQTEREFKA